MPVRARIAADTIDWDLASGDRVRVSMLLPRNRTVTEINENEAWTTTQVAAGQRKWHVRVAPQSQQDWDTFLNVIEVHQPGGVSNVQLVTSPSEQVEGAIIPGRGAPDVLALFNARPGPQLPMTSTGNGITDPANASKLRQAHVRTDGFSVRWTGGAAGTRVFIADLDSSRGWNIQVDEGRPHVVPAERTGALAQIVVEGAGLHTLRVW